MENFVLKKDKDVEIVGYSWDIENPAKVVVLIHGVGEHCKRYNRLARKFNQAGFAMFGMDLRGHGQSSGKRGDCSPRKEVFKDIDALIEYAKGRHPECEFVLYGHSMGGNITLDYRNRGNLNGEAIGYIISAPWVKLVSPVSKWQVTLLKAVSKILPKFQMSASIDENSLGNKMNVAGYKKDQLVHNSITLRAAVECYDVGNALYDDTIEIKGEGRKRPMLLMHGDADVICDVNASEKVGEKQSDTCEFVKWPGLFHEIHNGGKNSRGEEVIAKAIEWINEL